MDDAVFSWIRDNLFDDETVSNIMEALRENLANRPPAPPPEVPEIEQEVRKVRGEMERLGQAIMSTSDAPGLLVEMLKEREKRLGTLEEKLVNARSSADVPADNIESIDEEQLHDIVAMMQRDPIEARKAIEAIVGGPLRFIPIETEDGKRYRIEGPMA